MCYVALGVCAALAACVGRNFHRLPPPQADRYTAESLKSETASAAGPGGAAQRFLSDQQVARNWRTRFGSPELDALVEESLRANPSVQAATAALRQAQENIAAQRGSYYPTVQAGFAATRQRRRRCAESELKFAQEAALAQLEAALAPLSRQLHTSRDLLATLTGKLPADFKPPQFELEQLLLPVDLPLGIPSQLVERRPDVRAAEAQLHAATAQVGVVIASLLPQVMITGDSGSSATAMADLFKVDTAALFQALGGSVTLTAAAD